MKVWVCPEQGVWAINPVPALVGHGVVVDFESIAMSRIGTWQMGEARPNGNSAGTLRDSGEPPSQVKYIKWW